MRASGRTDVRPLLAATRILVVEIARCAGTQFDPALAEIFVRAIRERSPA